MAKCVILEYYLIEPEPVVLQCFCFSTEAEVHDPSTLQQSLTVIHMEQKKKRKRKTLLYPQMIGNQYAQQRGLKKKSEFSSLVWP